MGTRQVSPFASFCRIPKTAKMNKTIEIRENGNPSPSDLDKFIEIRGNENLSPSDFDKIIESRENGILSPSDFEKIYHMGLFGSEESRSGPGSTMEQTTHLRGVLAQIFEELGVKALLDVPCGDFNWMRYINMSNMQYIGGDVVADMVKKNNDDFGSENVEFRVMNIITDPLPKADIILCRDCIVHLKLEDGLKAIQNFKRSGATYLLATTFPDHVENSAEFRFWRTVNLENSPFNLPKPLRIINEKNTEIHLGDSYRDKSLGLWLLQDI